jgi:hypothetical protein
MISMNSCMRTISMALMMMCAHARVEISCSAFLYGQNDWQLNGTTSHCIEEVGRVRQNCGGTKLNFVITQFWIDKSNNGTIDSFSTKVGLNVVPVNTSNLAIFTEGMTECFAAAIQMGFTTLEVTPHVDDGMGRGGWRNTLIMNPLRRYDGVYSYYDIMIKPLVTALISAVGEMPNISIYMSMQGEMNAMLWRYPVEWLRLTKSIKCMLPNNAKTGLSVNFNKLCGDYCNPQVVNSFNLPAVYKLLNSIDFLGMSSYPITSVIPALDDFQTGVFPLADEFRMLGVDFAKLVNRPNFELHFSEFGNGGASCSGGPATTPSAAVGCPYFGIFGDFQSVTNPWASTQMKDFITKYYQQATRWASGGTGPTFKVTNVYIWNVASWDVTGIYHSSYNEQGSYVVPGVVAALKEWNDHGVVKGV